MTIIGATQSRTDNDFYYFSGRMFLYCLAHCGVLFYRVLHIMGHRKYYAIVIALPLRVAPFLISLWTYGDVILDVGQTTKYYQLSVGGGGEFNNTHYIISPYYFAVSVFSFMLPVLICTIGLLHLIYYGLGGWKSPKAGYEHSTKRMNSIKTIF